ncbi:blastoderm-specific protein 25D [Trichogramma pretiosum]|uniref:blastoderm-specific protein 25D n=1 Tax=Trichogramma pretiosum TaxID=7493 RepID=UPI0006C9AF4E|nr:blastoderm-specific protein 25D [Trichogramma pretiosum]XP_014234041.1 blastoderm-specific protein 25D [Trichogramma pretiosum]XP_014234042.1 blastoderm-specific protein 25D [Trichogramma pretiosum]
MEEELSDPYEQRLLAAFKSCLTKDQKELDRAGLSLLCSELGLEESQQNALMELVKVETTVSFPTFRDGFLAYLNKKRPEAKKNGVVEELENGYTCVDNRLSNEMKVVDNDNHVEIAQNNDKKLQEILNNHGSIVTEGTNSFCKDSILPKQTVEQIFEKLDLDCDGLINLPEFLLFFQNANSKLQEYSVSNWFSQIQKTHEIKTEVFKDIDNHETGVVSRSHITELWKLGGVTEANSLLLDLGCEGPTVNLIELLNALSSELKLNDVSHDGDKQEYIRLLKGALILYQEEVRNINTTMEHLMCERDKLRLDITAANDRANDLLKEIDDHQNEADRARQQHMHQLRQLEQRHSDNIKDLTDKLQAELDKGKENVHAIELKLFAAQLEESKIKADLVTALEDVKALEQENQNQAEKIRRLEGEKNELERQILTLASELKVANLENPESKQIVELTERMRQLQTEMKELRDRNDELHSELESLRNREHDANSVAGGRSTSDENDVPTEVDTEDEEGKPLKRETRTKAKSTKESQTTNTNEKLGDIIKDLNGLLIRTNFCNECDQVRSNIISLVEQLEQYRSSQLSPGRRRKQVRDLANELANTTNNRTTSCLELSVPQQLSSTNKRISSSNDTINELKLHDNMDSSDLRAYFKTKLATLPYKSSQEWKPSTEELLREVEAKHNMERRKLTDKISELERSLEKLRTEYDQCEEYWVLKLDEERQIFEQEQKENSEKFNELLDKITEYEEQYADDSVKQSTPGRLSPIEERSILEQQYSDLEEEFERWRRHAQIQLDSREMEIQDLKSKLKGKSSVDEEVQCPDEQMKKDYPALYSMLIKNTDEPDSSSTPIPLEVEKEEKKECTQCHKSISVNSECSCKTPPQQQPTTKPQNPSVQSPRKPSSYYYHQSKSHRRDDGRSSKYLHNHHRYFSQQQPHQQTQYQQQHQAAQQYWNDRELRNLQRQKDRLRQEIVKLQTLRAGYPVTMDEHGIFSNLCAKLYAAEQRYKYLQMFYQVQQTEQERIRQVMWKQHMLETADLRCIIKNTENKLNQQIKLYKEQTEKLTKADFLAKELYVENAQLTETIKRLEQHCQILTQDKIDTKTPA